MTTYNDVENSTRSNYMRTNFSNLADRERKAILQLVERIPGEEALLLV